MRNSFIPLIIEFIIIFLACQKELDLWDDYEVHLIVYNRLGPNDSISYVRIEKAY